MKTKTLILVSLNSEALKNEPTAVELITAALLKLKALEINPVTYLLVEDIDHIHALLVTEAFGKGDSKTVDVYRIYPLSAFLVTGNDLHVRVNELCNEHLKEELTRLASRLPR